MATTAIWLENFLRARDLPQLDGGALYAYRCARGEFEMLTQALRHVPRQPIDRPGVRDFVLYVAQ